MATRSRRSDSSRAQAHIPLGITASAAPGPNYRMTLSAGADALRRPLDNRPCPANLCGRAPAGSLCAAVRRRMNVTAWQHGVPTPSLAVILCKSANWEKAAWKFRRWDLAAWE
jgi:hypothetical protein